jgi:glycosyltransferase involved in cell wall biosynthesis
MVSQHPYPANPTLRRNVDYLVEQGIRLDVLSTKESDADAEAAQRPGLRLWGLRLRHRRTSPVRYLLEYGGFFLWALPRVWRLSLQNRYDAVQVDNVPDFLVFLAWPARLRGARIVFFMYELMPELAASRMKISARHPVIRVLRAVERMAARWADHVVVVTEPYRRRLVGRAVDGGRVTVVPNTPNTLPGRSWPAAERPASAVLVTHTTLIERYGVQVAIRAMALLRDEWPDLVLEVLGEGEYSPALRALAAELGVAERVAFLGFMPWASAMARVRKASVGLVPVLDDGYGELLLPTKLLDYVSQGVPAVCSRLQTISEYFPPDGIAYFEPDDEVGLAEEVNRLLRHPEEAAEQVLHAQEAFARISWEKVSGQYLEALGTTA